MNGTKAESHVNMDGTTEVSSVTQTVSNVSLDGNKAVSSVNRPHFYLENSVGRRQKCLSRIAYCINMCIT